MTKLAVPYINQTDSDADELLNDCGIACVAMMHDTSTNPERVTIVTSGNYLVSAKIVTNSSEINHIYLRKNNTTNLIELPIDAGYGRQWFLPAVLVTLEEDDYLTIYASNSGGSSYNVSSGIFTVAWNSF